MSCTRRGFLKTIGAAMVGLGLTRLEPLRSYAASSVGSAEGAAGGGPPTGPFSIGVLRARAVDAARWVGDEALADEISDVCCWAPAAAAIRRRPLGIQRRGAQYFFRDFPGGDQLADILLYSNNTAWGAPRFRHDPETLVARHYSQLSRPDERLSRLAGSGIRTEVVSPGRLNGEAGRAQLNLMFDRETGERLAQASDRSEPMWAAISLLSGVMLDSTDDLSRQLNPRLSFRRREDRVLGRTAAVRYSQIVLGAAQRAVWSDMLDGANPAMPLLQLSAGGYLPLGEIDGRFLLMRVAGGRSLTGYQTGNA